MMNKDKEDKVKSTLIHQLENFWTNIDREAIYSCIPKALDQMQSNFSAMPMGRFRNENGVNFNILHSVSWSIFLYRISRLLYIKGNQYEADCVYYLNKIMNANDWYYEVQLPVHFMAEHPLGSVLGKAKYGDYLFVYQGTTIGGNRKNGKLFYPKLGNNLVLYANSTILGDTVIGNNVIISANTYLINENIPNNCIVFGQSPNLVIKNKTISEIRSMTKCIWD